MRDFQPTKSLSRAMVSLLCALALVITMIPAFPASAATGAQSGPGIVLPGDYARNGVKIDGIDFIVLKVADDSSKALLLAKEVQEQRTFDTSGSGQWKASSIRSYLNDTWLPSKPELAANAVQTPITTRENYWETPARFTTTEDKAFLLSEADVFGQARSSFEPRDYTVTDASGKGVRLIDEDGPRVATQKGVLSQWWMRTPVYTKDEVGYVCKIGKDLVGTAGEVRGVRPALWVKLAAISEDTTPGSIEVSPPTAVVGPAAQVQFQALVKDASGKRMADEYQDVSWSVSGMSDLGYMDLKGTRTKIWNNTKIDKDGRLELDEREKNDTVFTVTATSKANDKIVGTAQVVVNYTDWPVKTIQKTGPDKDNMIIVFVAEGFTKDEQGSFVSNATDMWREMTKIEPYRRYADKINVYAMCTDSIQSGITSGNQTFFQAATDGRSVSLPSETNAMFGRYLGPAFAKNHLDPGCEESDIDSYVVLANDHGYGGASYVNRSPEVNFHFLTTTIGYDRIATFSHELGHNLLGLGDEYNEYNGKLTEDNSPNMSRFGDPEHVLWREMLGYGRTCTHQVGRLYVSASTCKMNTSGSDPFCEICKLQGVRTLATNVNDTSMYVPPLQVTYGDRYTRPEEFTPGNEGDFYVYRANHTLTNTTLTAGDVDAIRGQTLNVRTVVQNLSPTEERKVRLDFEIRHADGSSTGVAGSEVFDVGAWTDRDARNKGRRTYNSDYDYKKGFPSGLKDCQLKVSVPADADLKAGDTVRYSATQVEGAGAEAGVGANALLADERTAATPYANVTVRYQDETGNALPDTYETVIPKRVGETFSWEPPAKIGNFKRVETTGDSPTEAQVGANGLELHYTYAPDPESVIPGIDPQPQTDPEPQPEPSDDPEQPSMPVTPADPQQPSDSGETEPAKQEEPATPDEDANPDSGKPGRTEDPGETDPAGTDNPTTPTEPTKIEEPAASDDPAQTEEPQPSDGPGQSATPVTPADPQQPVVPDGPEPAKQEEPATPDEDANPDPDKPEQPEKPAKSDSAKTEEPAEQSTTKPDPARPGRPAVPSEPSEPAAPARPDPAKTEEPAKPDEAANPDSAKTEQPDKPAKPANSDVDTAGARTATGRQVMLKIRALKVSANSIRTSWGSVPGAARYVFYMAPRGKGGKYKKVATLTKPAYTLKGLKKGTSYCYYVKALDKDGKALGKPAVSQVLTKGGEKSDSDAAKLTKSASKGKLSLKKGDSQRVVAKAKKGSDGLRHHGEMLRFASSDTDVATVTPKGKVKAVGKGKATISIFTASSKVAKVKVNVK